MYETSIKRPKTASHPSPPVPKMPYAIRSPNGVENKNASTPMNAAIATASSMYVLRMNCARFAGRAFAAEFPNVEVKSCILLIIRNFEVFGSLSDLGGGRTDQAVDAKQARAFCGNI